MRFLHPAARPRLTSPHRSLRVLSIIPLFVLIEYLLAYLFLITDSRPSVPHARARARLVHAHPAEPLVLAAPGGLRSGLVPGFGSASQSVNVALTGYWSASQTDSVTD